MQLPDKLYPATVNSIKKVEEDPLILLLHFLCNYDISDTSYHLLPSSICNSYNDLSSYETCLKSK